MRKLESTIAEFVDALLQTIGEATIDELRELFAGRPESERLPEATGEFSAPRGGLVITTPVQLGRIHVLPIINQFLSSFPDITVSLLQSDRNIDLVDAHADLAVRIGDLADSSLVATRVGSLRPIVCASPGFLKTHGVPREPDALVEAPCIVFDSPYLSPWRFRMPQTGKSITVAVEPRLKVSAPDAAVDAAVSGLGVTLVLEHDAAEAVKAGQLKVLLKEFEVEPVPVHMVHVSRNLMPIKLRRFIEFAAPKLRESLGHFGKT